MHALFRFHNTRKMQDFSIRRQNSKPTTLTLAETVLLLSKLSKPSDVITITLDADDIAPTPSETKATYQEIKDYVREHFGLSVSTLYIAQVKREFGLEVGPHYNHAKGENGKQLRCPEDKRGAIAAALKHFQMI